MSETIGILMVVLVLPLVIIMHYVTQWKTSRSLSGEDEQLLEELWESAQKMQSRINALETILDDEVPDWRRRV